MNAIQMKIVKVVRGSKPSNYANTSLALLFSWSLENEFNALPILLSLINPFVPNAPFLYSQKTSENLAVEKGCIWERMGTELNSTQLYSNSCVLTFVY